MMKLKTRSCLIAAVVTSVCLMQLVYFISYATDTTFYRDRNITLQEVERNLAQLRSQERRPQLNGIGDGVSCKHPELNVFDESIMKFFPPSPPLTCANQGKEPWVHVRGDTLVVDQNLVRERGIRCKFAEILRASDDLNKRGPTYSTDKEHKLRESDFVEADCADNQGYTWKSVLAGGWRNPKVAAEAGWNLTSSNGLPVNVLIWGFDSISRNTFMRKLPKSYDYLMNQLKGTVLKGYNIVGDGTPQALIPILTGKTEIELPDTRKRMGDAAKYVNVYPFVWKRYRSHGYVTNFWEDGAEIGTFQYRLKGFDEQPTHIYSRPFYLARRRLGLSRQCHHGKSVNLMVQDYFKTAWEAYNDKPKWFFGFQSEFSHDDHNRIGIVDDELLDYLKWFQDGGRLNNTVLVVMSDHGHRFAAIRETHQGKLEERMPWFYFRFPEWMEKQYPEAIANFRANSQLLSTPFDIHETLEDLLNFKSVDFNADVREDLGNPSLPGAIPRGISLFRKIPRDRTCSDASIEAHWCACLQWEPLSADSKKALAAAQAVIDVVNDYNAAQLVEFKHVSGVVPGMCAKWKVGKIIWAARFASNDKLLKFSHSRDADGFHAELGASTAAAVEIYQVSFIANPGAGQFEATAHYDVAKKSYRVEIAQVSRISKYKSQAFCVAENLHQLRKFCNCQK